MKQKLFYFVVLLAFFLRFFKLGLAPAEMNRDEASLGYTAYSILLTGHEEHGQYWPIQIESFGDWKLPLYVYSLIPFIKVFGLEIWVVRLPSMLAGVGIVWLVYFLVKELFKKYKLVDNLALTTALFVAVSPWSIHFSHIAYEAHLSMFFFLLGLLGLLKVKTLFLEQKLKKIGLLIASISSLLITMLGYHAYQVFIPLFLLGFAWLYKDFWLKFFSGKNLRKELVLVAIPFMITGIVLILSGVSGANSTKFSGLSIFSLEAYVQPIAKKRFILSDPNNFFVTLSLNKFTGFIDQVTSNFFLMISPEFLFMKGGDNGAHNITGFGNFYPLVFFGLVVGLVQIFMGFGNLNLLGIWLLVAMVAPMITFQANHTIRFSPAFIAIEILSAYGWFEIFSYLKQKISRKIFLAILLIIAIGFFYFIYKFLFHYYFIFPSLDAKRWSWQMKPLAFQVDFLKDNYDKVIVEGEQSSPYIYFLFHLKIDPATLANRLEYYPADKEGFRHVKRLDNIYFERVNWNIDDYLDEDRLFVVSSGEIPSYNQTHARFKLLNKLANDQVDQQIEFWQYEHF